MGNKVVFKNGYYLNSKTRSFEKADIVIEDGVIAQIGENLTGDEIIDITGKTIVPGFINGHVHFESSMLTPLNYAKVVAIHGTTSAIIDPHEITNVCKKKKKREGEKENIAHNAPGFVYTIQATKGAPIDFFPMVPSCVPATPYDISGGKLDSKTAEVLLKYDDRVKGLAEVMNLPGVVYDDPDLIGKISAAKKLGKKVDGHAPGAKGETWKSYFRKSGATADHECTTIEEALTKFKEADEVSEVQLQQELDKLKAKNIEEYYRVLFELEKAGDFRLDKAEELGLIEAFYLQIRQGTAAQNLPDLVEILIKPEYQKYRNRIMFVTDDKEVADLMDNGEIDNMVRLAIEKGVKPEEAYITACTNGTRHYNLNDRGQIEVGKVADMLVISDIEKCKIDSVYKNGLELTTDILKNWEEPQIDSDLIEEVENTINLPEGKEHITLEDISTNGNFRKVIGMVPNQIITTDNGVSKDYDLDKDIIKISVMDIHGGTGKVYSAFLQGMGLKKGAFATTIAHDSHYLVAAGTNDEELLMAMNRAIDLKGGLVHVEDGKVKNELQLEVAGIATKQNPNLVRKELKNILEGINVNKGITPMTLSFVPLPVIPKMGITPNGVIDVEQFKIITQEEMNKESEIEGSR